MPTAAPFSTEFKTLARPTILQVIPSLNIGGAERTTLDIARAIIAAGGRALVASSGGRLVPELLAMGAEHFEINARSKNPVIMALNVERLTHLIRREKVDLVHARSRAPAWSALAAAHRTSRPFVTTYHSKVHEGPGLKVFYNSVMARGDAIIANSAYTAERIARIHAPDGTRIFTVPRGIDTHHFDPFAIGRDRLEALRQRWKLDDDGRVVFMLPARLTRWKGQGIAIEAATALKALHGNVFKLLLVGDAQGRDAFESELHDMITARALHDNVQLTGPCDDMPAAYALCDVVLSPSIEPEPFGRTAVEAQAMEKPVIASDSGGQRETVLTRESVGVEAASGIAVHAGDVTALMQAMADIVALGVDARRQMGARGRANVLARFSLEAMANATLDIYSNLLKPASHA